MKIKLAIYSTDKYYVEHLVNYLNIHHHDKIELSAFNEEESLKAYLRLYKPDIVLVDDNLSYISENSFTVTIFLSDMRESEREKVSIFKYQKGELIYKRILNLYASGAERGLRYSDKDKKEARLTLFLPVHGGAGCSTVAMAYARKCASNCRALYLNMEIFGNCGEVLKSDGNLTFQEVLYALKSRRGNITLKLESALKKNQDGILFYEPSENPADLLELTGEELQKLLSEIRDCGLFDEIILDMDLYPTDKLAAALWEADRIWLIADGSESSTEKYKRFEAYIAATEQKHQKRLRPKMYLFYNRFSSRNGKTIDNCELEVIGGSPRYEGISKAAIVERMSDSEAFVKCFTE